MQPRDKGLQLERTLLAQRRTALLMFVLMVASMRFVGLHAGSTAVGMMASTVLLGLGNLALLRVRLSAEHLQCNLGQHFRRGNAILSLSTVQIAANVLL